MTNLEKMNELVGQNATKKQIANWSYMNRIPVNCIFDEREFESMEQSVNHFCDSEHYGSDEHENWDKFLDAEYVEAV